MNKYISVIGLEIHVELSTKSKMFCQCAADWFGREPNTLTCPVCLGLPGALPVPNKKAIEWTILIGKALNCTINKVSKFDRKHYFYPDLPKGYQISQYDEPIAINGSLKIKDKNAQLKDEEKTFRIRRVHLEEDTGKLIHKDGDTLVDFNRSGVPLVEIVTEPDFDNSQDVKRFLEVLHTIIQQYLKVSDANMEQGSMRLEPNISLSGQLSVTSDQETENRKLKSESRLPPYKVEVKNINSFRYVAAAIEYEIKRQAELLEKGETPVQETRGYNENKKITVSQRTKEEAHDYRYFPEPDIPPLRFNDDYLKSIKVPELPAQKVQRYIENYGIRQQDAEILTKDARNAHYFEQVISNLKGKTDAQKVANAIVNKRIPTSISSEEFAQKINMQGEGSGIDEKLLEKVVQSIVSINERAVQDYKRGKESAIMFLVGQVMRELKGQADATKVKEELIRKLK